MPQPRAWLTLLAFVLALGVLADRADAQAFKPRSRNGIAAKRGPTTPVAAATPTRTAVTTPAPAPRKAPAAAPAPAKAVAKKAPAKKKSSDDDDDDVVVTDGDD